jgi:fermentation-respiration switch protein FrsA (DUF1100 family)
MSAYSGLLLAPDSRLADVPAYLQGISFSLEALWPQLMGWRLLDGGGEFAVPLTFIEGDLDLQVPASLVTEILPKLRAPAVELVTLEGGAHCAIVSHADRFFDALVHRVKPRTAPPAKPKRRRAKGV